MSWEQVLLNWIHFSLLNGLEMDRTWKEMRAYLSLPPGQMAISLTHCISSSGFWIHLYFFMLACWTFEWKWSREYAAIGTTHHWWATKCQRPTTHNLPNGVKELALKHHKVINWSSIKCVSGQVGWMILPYIFPGVSCFTFGLQSNRKSTNENSTWCSMHSAVSQCLSGQVWRVTFSFSLLARERT